MTDRIIPHSRRRWPTAHWLKWWVGAPLLLLSAAFVTWMYLQALQARGMSDPARARREGRPIPVRTALVTERDSDRLIGGTAVTVASEMGLVQIAPVRTRAQDPVSDVLIKSVHVQDGAYVRAGQLLFEVDDVTLREILRQRQVELQAAEGVLRARVEDSNHQQKLLEMTRKLSAGGLVSQAQLLEAESRVLTVKAALDEASSRVNLLRSDISVAQRDVGRFRITSPLDGYVSELSVVPGTVITEPTVLARVLRLDPLHIVMDFPQEHLREVFVGQKADTVLDSFPQETFEGTVVQVMPEVKRDLRVLPVLIAVRNADQRLKAGISGFSRLRVGGRRVTSVPTTALMEQGSKAVVFRVADGRARLREVRIGAVVENGWREVYDGLSPGDEVVVFNNFYRDAGGLTSSEAYLQDNDLVDADWRRWTRRE